MSDTYGVAAADVSAELPGLFTGGFSVSTVPTLAQVTSFITTADTIVTLRVTDDVAASPSSSDKAAVMAKRYIIDWVKAMVTRIVYGGNDPAQVEAAAGPYEKSAAAMLSAIDELGLQAIGDGTAASPKVLGSMSTRSTVLDDCDLDGGSRRGRF